MDLKTNPSLPIPTGIYKGNRGGLFHALTEAVDSRSGEYCVVYVPISGNASQSATPAVMSRREFCEMYSPLHAQETGDTFVPCNRCGHPLDSHRSPTAGGCVGFTERLQDCGCQGYRR